MPNEGLETNREIEESLLPHAEEKQEFYEVVSQEVAENYLIKIKELYLWLSLAPKEK